MDLEWVDVFPIEDVDIPAMLVDQKVDVFLFKQKIWGNLRDDECYELTGFCWVTGALLRFELRIEQKIL